MNRQREAPPRYPLNVVPNQCLHCHGKLVPGGRPRTWVHAATGSVRCPPASPVCGVCERDGLIACSDPACLIAGHPGGCVNQCVCCASWGCPAHVSTVDFLCVPCAEHGAGGHPSDADLAVAP